MATKEAQAMHVDELDSKQQIKLIMLRRSLVGWSVDLSWLWIYFWGGVSFIEENNTIWSASDDWLA